MKYNIIILSLIFFLVSTRSVHAYLDPGTGSFILQVVAAGALGGLFALKTFWRQIIDFFQRIFSKKTRKQAPVKKQKNAKK